jgi:hypothetical protein
VAAALIDAEGLFARLGCRGYGQLIRDGPVGGAQ